MAKASDQTANFASCLRYGLACVDHEICALPFDMIRHLKVADMLELGRGHTRPTQHPARLQKGGCRNDDRHIDLFCAAFFKQ